MYLLSFLTCIMKTRLQIKNLPWASIGYLWLKTGISGPERECKIMKLWNYEIIKLWIMKLWNYEIMKLWNYEISTIYECVEKLSLIIGCNIWMIFLRSELNVATFQRNWVFVTNSDFLIPISLQSNVADIWHFKLWLLLDQII